MKSQYSNRNVNLTELNKKGEAWLMKSIAMINFYFADKIPDYMDFYLSSLSYNNTIDLFLFTNLDISSPSRNIRIVKSSFEEFRAKIVEGVSREMKKRGYADEVIIESVYKLADFRPTFGVCFQDYLKDYDFWGGCDLDLVFGDVRKYLPDEILNHYDKIFEHGHFFLIRNEDECNTAFLEDFDYCFKGALHIRKNSFFEEVYEKPWLPHGGVNSIFDRRNKLYKNRKALCDVSFKYGNLIDLKNPSGGNRNLFVFSQGNLFRYSLIDGQVVKDEVFYAHFQKRHLEAHTKEKNKFIVGNTAFEPYEEIDEKTFDKYTKKRNIVTKRYLRFRYMEAIGRKIHRDYKWR